MGRSPSGLAAVLAVACLSASVANAQTPAPAANGTPTPAPAAAGAPRAAESGSPGFVPAPRGDEVTLNFREADIESIVSAFAHLLGRNLVVDPRVRGKMSLETARPVPRAQALELLQLALRGQGFAFVETGGVMRVVPEAEARLQAVPVGTPERPARGGEQVVTQVFRLSHESATNLVPVLRPLIASNNTVVAYAGNNALVITDYASNIARIAQIIASLDTPSANEVEVIGMNHALAADVAVSVNRLLDDSGRSAGQQPGQTADTGTQRVMVMADPRLNAVMIRTSSPERMKLARSLVARLDQPSSEPGNIHVVYLRNAEAVKLAQTLRGVLSGDSGGLTGSQPGLGGSSTFGQSLATANSPAGSTVSGTAGAMGASGAGPLGGSFQSQQNVQSLQGTSVRAGAAIITADPASNALIITAPEAVYRSLRAVIDRLDARRAQVFIESLIVEVQAEKAAEFGIQWQFLGTAEGSTRGIGGTSFNGATSGANILGIAASPATIANGLNIGIVRGTAKLGSTEVMNLGLLARALESDTSANILATPNLLTLDNEEARIVIGQNVPFITGQFTATGTGGASVNPFQTIERRDVGTTLRVKPQISESGTVRLQIFQEVSSVQDKANATGIITNRRAIESNVLVDDGEIIVLGGLLEESIAGSEQKVPGLGDLPVIGGLFRYDSRKRVKTNLLVFLRPVVLRDADASNSVTATRYDYIRALRGDARIPARTGLSEMSGNPLPAMPVPAPAGQARLPAVRQPPLSLSPEVSGGGRPSAPFANDSLRPGGPATGGN